MTLKEIKPSDGKISCDYATGKWSWESHLTKVRIVASSPKELQERLQKHMDSVNELARAHELKPETEHTRQPIVDTVELSEEAQKILNDIRETINKKGANT